MFTGRNFGKYEISSKIGSGGMGEVYRATDTELGRDVALKVLLDRFCKDEDRVKRFKYEARAVSALNHPGILTIYEIVENDETMFIATELVDGVTLRDMIAEGNIELSEAIYIAEQVAESLAVAHAAGIIHRDIKPENIMIRKDGRAKVLDFGLAKPIFADGRDAALLAETQPGLVIGSVRYMSPEQARGKETDGRTDIWSLGVVLYEMMTGKTPFDGETVSDQLAALIHSDPEPLSGVPSEIDEIVRKCLQKEPSERYQSIGELAADLREMRLIHETGSREILIDEMAATIALPKQNTSESATLIHRTISSDHTTGDHSDSGHRTTETPPVQRSGYLVAAAAVLAVFLGLGGWFVYSAWTAVAGPSFESIQVRRLTEDGHARTAAVSPDGKLVVYEHSFESQSRLLVMQVATGTEVEIVPETQLKFLQPSFSADGNFVYYVSKNNGLGTLFKVPSLGGESVMVSKDVDTRPAVSPDGKSIAFARHDPNRGGDTVLIVDSAGGEPEPLFGTGDIGFDQIVDLFWSADGERLLASGRKSNDRRMKASNLASIDVKSKKVVEDPLVSEFENKKWEAANGFAALFDNSGLVFVGIQPGDETSQIWHLDLSDGKTRTVTTDTSDYSSVSVSNDGKVVVATKLEWISGLSAFDPNTKKLDQLKPENRKLFGYNGIDQTPEGNVLFAARDGRESNIYSYDPKSGGESRLTSGGGLNVGPVSASTGGTVVYASHKENSHGLWKVDGDGSNQVQLTKPEKGVDVNPVFINGDKTLIFVRQEDDGGRARLMKVPAEGGEPVELLPGSGSSNMRPTVSADGKSLAFFAFSFNADATVAKTEIRFADLDGDKAMLREERIPTQMHGWFKWAPSGKEITATSAENNGEIVNISIDGGKTTDLMKLENGFVRSFTWSRDGTRLFVVKGISNSDLVLVRKTDTE